ncbi:hypothetical protein A2U01_0035331, partial [Trifolium medium]|nr:hypothetical protein [Trifolium medium]
YANFCDAATGTDLGRAGVWHWNMSWRCPLLRLEEPDRADLMQLLDGISPNARPRISGSGCWIR